MPRGRVAAEVLNHPEDPLEAPQDPGRLAVLLPQEGLAPSDGPPRLQGVPGLLGDHPHREAPSLPGDLPAVLLLRDPTGPAQVLPWEAGVLEARGTPRGQGLREGLLLPPHPVPKDPPALIHEGIPPAVLPHGLRVLSQGIPAAPAVPSMSILPLPRRFERALQAAGNRIPLLPALKGRAEGPAPNFTSMGIERGLLSKRALPVAPSLGVAAVLDRLEAPSSAR